jgi:hypothetical protein
MNRYLRILGVVLAASGVGIAVVGLSRSWSEKLGPWTSIGLSLVLLSLVCLALGIRGKRDA